jgi:hypothetical protein
MKTLLHNMVENEGILERISLRNTDVRTSSSVAQLNPLTQNDLQRRRAMSPLKMEIPVKISAGSVARMDLIPMLKVNPLKPNDL